MIPDFEYLIIFNLYNFFRSARKCKRLCPPPKLVRCKFGQTRQEIKMTIKSACLCSIYRCVAGLLYNGVSSIRIFCICFKIFWILTRTARFTNSIQCLWFYGELLSTLSNSQWWCTLSCAFIILVHRKKPEVTENRLRRETCAINKNLINLQSYPI